MAQLTRYYLRTPSPGVKTCNVKETHGERVVHIHINPEPRAINIELSKINYSRRWIREGWFVMAL